MTTPVDGSQDNGWIESMTSSGKSAMDAVSSAAGTCYKAVADGVSGIFEGASSVTQKSFSFMVSTYKENPRISQAALGTIALVGAAYALRGYAPDSLKSMFSGTSNTGTTNS